MIRWTIAMVAFFGCISFASAEFVRPRGELSIIKSTARQFAELSRTEKPKQELVITAETEIMVDGHVCGLAQVPTGAEIILIDVAADRSIIRRIHFQSKK